MIILSPTNQPPLPLPQYTIAFHEIVKFTVNVHFRLIISSQTDHQLLSHCSSCCMTQFIVLFSLVWWQLLSGQLPQCNAMTIYGQIAWCNSTIAWLLVTKIIVFCLVLCLEYYFVPKYFPIWSPSVNVLYLDQWEASTLIKLSTNCSMDQSKWRMVIYWIAMRFLEPATCWKLAEQRNLIPKDLLVTRAVSQFVFTFHW